MALLDLAFVVVIAVTLGLCTAATVRLRAPGGGPQAWAAMLTARIGAVPTAVAVVVVGWLVTIAVMVPLGLVTRASTPHFDRPIFRWVSTHAGGPHTHVGKLMATLTEMGSRPDVEIVTLAGVLILAIAYGRRWWLPILTIGVSVLMQREGQNVLTRLVHRAPPPAPHAGVFPSGGVSRIFAVYGIIAVLAVLLLPRAQQHRWRARAVNGIILFSVIEGFTRVYTSLHWTTDTLTGLIFGGLLLSVETTALHALSRRTEPEPTRPTRQQNGAPPSAKPWQPPARNTVWHDPDALAADASPTNADRRPAAPRRTSRRAVDG